MGFYLQLSCCKRWTIIIYSIVSSLFSALYKLGKKSKIGMYDFPHVWSLTRGDTCHAIVYNTNAQLTLHQCILVMSSNNNGCFV